jgi:hypothetical protein
VTTSALSGDSGVVQCDSGGSGDSGDRVDSGGGETVVTWGFRVGFRIGKCTAHITSSNYKMSPSKEKLTNCFLLRSSPATLVSTSPSINLTSRVQVLTCRVADIRVGIICSSWLFLWLGLLWSFKIEDYQINKQTNKQTTKRWLSKQTCFVDWAICKRLPFRQHAPCTTLSHIHIVCFDTSQNRSSKAQKKFRNFREWKN